MSALGKIDVSLKTGFEKLSYDNIELGASLLDFWRWSVSDIVSNSTRGVFAEFIVAKAMNIDTNTVRDEWANYDLDSPEGIKIEVKSAAYIQTWHQKQLSPISFSVRETHFWDETQNARHPNSKRHADVYVFCLLSHLDKQTIDPLNLKQWEFYVVPTFVLNHYTRSKRSITLNSLQKLTPPINYTSLKQAIIDSSNKNEIIQ